MSPFTESARQWAEHTPEWVRIVFWLAAWMAVSGTAALLVLRGVAL